MVLCLHGFITNLLLYLAILKGISIFGSLEMGHYIGLDCLTKLNMHLVIY